jgi:hypothetical protein
VPTASTVWLVSFDRDASRQGAQGESSYSCSWAVCPNQRSETGSRGRTHFTGRSRAAAWSSIHCLASSSEQQNRVAGERPGKSLYAPGIAPSPIKAATNSPALHELIQARRLPGGFLSGILILFELHAWYRHPATLSSCCHITDARCGRRIEHTSVIVGQDQISPRFGADRAKTTAGTWCPLGRHQYKRTTGKFLQVVPN